MFQNVYVHRRDSVSIAKLSKQEIEDRTRLGLIEPHDEHDDHEEEEEESEDEEEWNSIEEDEEEDDDDASFSDEDCPRISDRKSSVDPMNCISSPQGHGNGNGIGIGTQGMTSFDFSNVNSSRRTPLGLQRISEDDEATLQDDDDAMDL